MQLNYLYRRPHLFIEQFPGARNVSLLHFIRGEQMVTQFTCQTTILLARHFHTWQSTSIQTSLVPILSQNTKILSQYTVCMCVDSSGKWWGEPSDVPPTTTFWEKSEPKQNREYVRFKVFTAVTMKNGVFWDVMPCGSCKNQRFGGT
jgi:hypothetical protein